jgi:hypothetical protein
MDIKIVVMKMRNHSSARSGHRGVGGVGWQRITISTTVCDDKRVCDDKKFDMREACVMTALP